MPEPYPLRLERHLSPRLWGDPLLVDLLGIDAPGSAEPYGESWQVWGGNRIMNGPLAGSTLQEAADRWGAALLGSASTERYGNTFPLLLKFIAAAEDLSLQVHPDDAYALKEHPGSGNLGKAEAWLILAAKPGAAVYRGFRETVTKEQVREAVRAGTLTELLNRVPVGEGDVIWNPPGTVHAIGAGIVLFEAQQSSDLTYRLYDYGRTGADGRERELHVERALDVADLEGGPSAPVAPVPLGPGVTGLVDTEHFRLLRRAGGRFSTDTGSVCLLTAINGPVRLTDGAEQLELAAWESLVLPAHQREWQLEGTGQLLDCRLPGTD